MITGFLNPVLKILINTYENIIGTVNLETLVNFEFKGTNRLFHCRRFSVNSS